MSEEAKDDCDTCHDCASDVGGQFRSRKDVLKDGHEDRHARESNQRGCAINSDTANPFRQVIAMGVEDEPLIAQEGDGDGNEAGEEGRVHITEAAHTRKQPIEENKETVAKYGVKSSYEQVAENLPKRFVIACTHGVGGLAGVSSILMRSFSVTSGRRRTRV